MRNNLKLIGVVAMAALLVGCESRSFKAEREMFRVHKKAEAVYKNPKGTPPFQFQQVIDGYRNIVKKYPGSLFGVQASFSIGHLYVVKGDFEKGRQQYKTLTVDCDKKGNLCAEAYFAIGNSYELEQNWAFALTQYQHILTHFPLSSKSLDLPLYIIRHYRKANDPDNIKRFVDEAASYYLGLKSKAKTDQGKFILQSLVSRVYIEGAQWQDALDSLDKLLRDYPKNGPEETLWVKALIYYNQMKDTLKAKQELQKIVIDYPRSKLARQAEGLIKKL
jgi:tetratricopeptide (TPR) repeat protein